MRANPRPPDAPEPLAYSVTAAAPALSVGKNSIYRLINEGQLASVRIAGRRLILRDSILRLLKAQHPKPSACANRAKTVRPWAQPGE
jgi:excisionase family DNA binding protein